MNWNRFTAPNIGLLVYKRLYIERAVKERIVFSEENMLKFYERDNEKTTPFDAFYKAVFDKKLSGYTQIENVAATNRFNLQTTYPGLLCGSGYTHDSNAKGDMKVGFYFDHTTGQPVIPGSSIKGVIKRVFENENDVTDNTSLDALKFIVDEIIDNCPKEHKEQEKKQWDLFLQDLDVAALKKLKEQIFGKEDTEGKDVFFDAVIDIKETGKNKNFLASDFITPHPDPLKNPTPLMFIKVLSEITFEFRFKLTDSKAKIEKGNKNEEIILSARQKEKIFEEIIKTVGVGAKTNVGYGQFQ
ncbi:MAG: type III-B CRISPR module RAMP protein Cmr6 [Bacteroidales bacterium]|jgi:CRISPR-associated protein Cmr6|nr:type III-B CRISPR module RAMP protein Cmr6 [Bacteroidales bacterium]MDI9593450.1 type III-B CRISPR module RAMP protein Cmr6 [Bacteroidota bacterium]HOF17033.1 type III-B CRISPR module RAMP protein Cmr6 [Bacteroidales bacterium]